MGVSKVDGIANTSAGEPEKRTNPDDGKLYTFDELKAKYSLEFSSSSEELLEYWDTDCEPAKAPGRELVEPTSPSTRPKKEVGNREVMCFTVEEVAQHTSREDAWIMIDDLIYDVGKFLRTEGHPGGEVILTRAGKDATDEFFAYHPDHVRRRKLPKYLVGAVKDPVPASKMVQEYRAMRVEIEKAGLYDVHPGYWVLKVVYPGLLLAIAVLLFRSGIEHWLVHLAAGILVGLAQHQWAFVGHDACHEGCSMHWGLDFMLSICVATLGFGVSSIWWKYTHNQHHIVTNEHDRDPDVTHLPFFAVSKYMFLSKSKGKAGSPLTMQFTRFMVGIQWLTFLPIMMVIARASMIINMFVMMFVTKRVPTMQWQELHLSAFWCWADRLALIGFIAWNYVLFSYAPPAGFRMLALCGCWLMVSFLHVQLTMSHWDRPMKFSEDETDSWFVKQVVTGRNIEGNIFNEWFLGGLHFQIEHHIYPRMPRHALRQCRDEFVLPFCKKWEIPYCSTGFWHSMADVMRTLSDVSSFAHSEVCA